VTAAAFGDPDGLRHAAAALQHAHAWLDQASRALVDLASELAGAAAPWQGAASQAFQVLSGDRRGAVEDVAAAVAATSGVLDRLAGRLQAAREQALAARSLAEASGVPVDADFRVVAVLAAAPADPGLVAAMARAHATLDAAHAAAGRAWQDAAAELAAVRLSHHHGGGNTLGQVLGALVKLRDAASAPSAAAAKLERLPGRLDSFATRTERAWEAMEEAAAARYLANPQLHEAARRTGRAAVRGARGSVATATEAARRAAAFAERLAGPDGVRAQALRVIGAEVGELGDHAARVPGLRRLPVVGVALAGSATVAESGQAGWGRSAAANGGALAAGEAAAVGVTAAAAIVGAPVAVTVGAVAVAGYGVGTAVHSLVLHGDLREFGADAHAVAGGASKLFEKVTPW
jgi:uncharacterized protein YukE